MNKILQKPLNKLLELYKKYENNDFVLEKISDSICNKLPIEAVCWCKEMEKNAKSTKKISFILKFMTNETQYFSSNNLYIKYDGKNYSQISEDELLYKILSKISKEKSLLKDKQEIKNLLIEKIRDNPITNGIPESITIQNVMKYLYPILFNAKAEAKYFLTILGDNILKKKTNIFHIVNNNAKSFLDHILFCYKDYFNNGDIVSSFYFGKLQEDSYNKYRLIDFKDSIENQVYWKFFIEQNILNIVAVALHYSQRYENSEIYLKDKVENKDKILFFKNKNESYIIQLFCENYLVESEEKTIITDMEINYLWERFLEFQNIPDITLNANLKIKNKTHKHLFILRKFMSFWENKIISDMNDEIEISEIFYFFKIHTGIKTTNERELLKIIINYLPYIKILNNKVVQGYRCLDWDKKASIKKSINSLVFDENISKIDMYKKYYKTKPKMIVSKTYFIDNIDFILNEN
tara:strand:- start:4115 stop:5509 length:1395 start_codon:yes stop_codon:yes gene_type:complete